MSRPIEQPRRQARGRRRIEQILDAAAQLFSEVGYEAATTNAIAARAGISPGSLYQFFPNKEAIADGLAARYTEVVTAAHGSALTDVEGLALDALVDRVVDTIVAFNVENPAYKALLADPAVPARLSAASQRLHETLVARVEAIIATRAPHLTASDARRNAVVIVQMFKAMLPVIVESAGSERSAYTDELKRALHGYIEQIETPQTRRP